MNGSKHFFYVPVLFCLLLQIVCFLYDDAVPEPLFYGRFFWLTNICCALILTAGVSALFLRKKYGYIHLGWIDVVVFVFACYVLGNSLRRGIYVDSILPVVLGMMVVPVIKQMAVNCGSKQSDLLAALFWIWSLLMLCQTVLVFLQFGGSVGSFHTAFDITGAFHNPGPLGIWIAVSLPVVAGCVYHTKSNLLKAVLASILIAACCVLIISGSRTAWLAILAAIVYVFKNILGRYYTKWRGAFRIGLPVLLTVFWTLCYVLYKYKPDSVQGRFFIWTIGANMMSNHALLGNGTGGFSREFGKYLADFFSTRMNVDEEAMLSERANFAFNDFLQVGVEQGGVGLLFFVTIFIAAFRASGRCEKSPLRFAGAALAAFAVSCLFSYPCETPALWASYILLLGMISTVDSCWKIRIPLSAIRVMAVISVVLSVVMVALNARIYGAKIAARNAITLLQQNSSQEAAGLFKTIYPTLRYDYNVALHYAKSLYNIGAYPESISVLKATESIMADPFMYIAKGASYERLNETAKAADAYKYASLIEPKLMYPKYLLAKLYLGSNDMVNACIYARQVLTMRVKVQSAASRQMRAELAGLCDN